MVNKAHKYTKTSSQIILGTNPSMGDTLLQDLIARDLEKIQISYSSEMVKFSQAYITLAAKTSRAFRSRSYKTNS